jgi:hypothetical protein
MVKKAKTGAPKTANKIKTAAAIVAISTSVACEHVEQPVVEWAAPLRKYDGDYWELQNAIQNGFLSDINPTGDLRSDFGAYLFGQGGGKSNDQNDQICKQPNAWPKTADKDGYRYHTVHDITHVLFCDPKICAWVGYNPTDELFYSMPEKIRNGIIDYHIHLGQISTSEPVNLVAAYCNWGGGGHESAVKVFEQQFGNIEIFIELKGDYFIFYNLLEIRRQLMAANNYDRICFVDVNGARSVVSASRTQQLFLTAEQVAFNKASLDEGKINNIYTNGYFYKSGGWPTYGRGWSNGLAQFHRVFKVYCSTEPKSNYLCYSK